MQVSDQEQLFAKGHLKDFLQAQIGAMQTWVSQMPQARFAAASNEALLADITGRFAVQPLALQDALPPTFNATQVIIPPSRDYGRIWPAHPEAGHRMCVVVPFTGHAGLWSAQPENIGI